MSPALRRLLFVLFVGGFLISAPVVVLYTAGYRFNASTGHLVQTGLFSIDTVPADMQVAIDGKTRPRATPMLVKNVLPGLHAVALTGTGYLPWEKRLQANSRETTFVTRVVLFADAPAAFVRETDAGSGVASPAGDAAAWVHTQGPWSEIWTYGMAGGDERLIARLPAAAQTPRLAWSPDGGALAVTSGARVFLVDVRSGLRTDVPAGRPLGWDAAAGAHYLLARDGDVFSVGVGAAQPALLAAGSLTAVADPQGAIALQAAGDRLALARPRAGAPVEILAYVPRGDYAFVPARDGWLLLHDAAQRRLVLVAKSGDRPVILNATAERWAWEPDGRRLLYSDGFDIHVFNPDAGTDETVTRFSEPLTGLAWHPAGSSALFTQGGRLAAIEFDARDTRLITPLSEGRDLRAVWTDARARTAFFFGTADGKTGLFRRPLQQ